MVQVGRIEINEDVSLDDVMISVIAYVSAALTSTLRDDTETFLRPAPSATGWGPPKRVEWAPHNQTLANLVTANDLLQIAIHNVSMGNYARKS